MTVILEIDICFKVFVHLIKKYDVNIRAFPVEKSKLLFRSIVNAVINHYFKFIFNIYLQQYICLLRHRSQHPQWVRFNDKISVFSNENAANKLSAKQSFNLKINHSSRHMQIYVITFFWTRSLKIFLFGAQIWSLWSFKSQIA